jgi:hypothetical protein
VPDVGRLRSLAGTLSPRRRRWLRFLDELPLDPDDLPDPLPAPGPDDVILCGCPRSGTSLLAAALFQPPTSISIMEPWDGMRLAPADLFASLRAELAEGRLARGRLDLDGLVDEGTVRWCLDGASARDVQYSPSSVVSVKWPAYWRYLDRLPATRFVVTLRHPAEVIGSFKAQGGRVGLGLQYQTAFNRALNAELEAATPDPARRRVLLFDHVHEQLLPHLERPEVFAVRYERWFQDPEQLLAELGAFLGTDVTSPPITLRPARGSLALDDRDWELLRAHCHTAERLGYDIGARP